MFRRKPAQPTLLPEWLLVGLGNPGAEYAHTRHNVGFDWVDRVATQHRIRLGTRKHRAVYGTGEVNGVPVVLAKPMTFMNLSGQAVAPLLREFGLKPDRLVVITDDLDLEVGRVRMKPHGGHGGHNGHRSIIQALSSDQYARIKIGIGRSGDTTVDHVLSRFNPTERERIDEALARVDRTIDILMSHGLERALTEANRPDPAG